MTILNDRPITSPGSGDFGPSTVTSAPKKSLGKAVVNWITSTDHKVIGYMYLITSMVWFLIAGLMALAMRAELAIPGMQVVSLEQYNQLFTMHGTIMLFLFATPLFVGFGNVIMPLQIGAPDVAFPRLNMFGYWLFLFGGLIVAAGFFTPGGAAAFGWFAYAPLSNAVNSPEVGADLWLLGLTLGGLGTILSSVNFITTIFTMRAPGMTMFRMPIFCWTILITSLLVLIAFPVLAAALSVAFIDRQYGAVIFAPENGGAILWQHLFWFFGHPEVYIIALPFFGIASEIIPAFSRKPVFGYKGLIFATMAIGALSVAVWAHHMYVTGSVYLPFFALTTMLIAVPTGVKFFNWIGTMWRGSISFDTPDAVDHGLFVHVPLRRSDRCDPCISSTGLCSVGFLLRGRSLPLHGVWHGRIHDVRRVLLLVAKNDRQNARREIGQNPLLAVVHRFPSHVLGPALAWSARNATPLWRLPPHRRLPNTERCLHRGRGNSWFVHTVLYLERVQDLEECTQGDS